MEEGTVVNMADNGCGRLNTEANIENGTKDEGRTRELRCNSELIFSLPSANFAFLSRP
jgi:hypothetical protein